MESPNLVKVVAAFVSGVVIALGSALIYVRVSEMAHPQPTVVAQSATDVPQPVAMQASEPVQPPPEPASVPSSTPAPVPEPRKTSIVSVTHRRAAPPPPHRPQAKVAPKVAMAQLAAIRWPAPEPATYASTPVEAPPPEPTSAPTHDNTPNDTRPTPAQAPPEPNPGPQPHAVTLQAGTAVPIRLTETLSTDHNYTGDTFRGTLEAAIIMDGFIIADRGSKVLGRVISAEKAGTVEGTADLSVTLTEINTTDGQRIQIAASSIERRGATSNGEDAAKIAGGAALGAIIGAAAAGGKGAAIGAGIGGAAGTGIVFATRGKAAMLPVESRLTFRLAAPLTITEKLN